MCRRENFLFSDQKIYKVYKLMAFLKTLQRLKQEWQESPALDKVNRARIFKRVWGPGIDSKE